MAITLVQKSAWSTFTATSGTITLNGVGAGNLLVAVMLYGANSTSRATVSDNNSNSWNAAVGNNYVSVGGAAQGFYAANAKGGNTTFTLNAISGSFYSDWQVQEWSGCATTSPLIGTDSLNAAASTSHNMGATGITSSGAALYVGAAAHANTTTYTPGSGYTTLGTAGQVYDFGQEGIFSTAQTLNKAPYTTGTSQASCGILMAFKAAGTTNSNFLMFM